MERTEINIQNRAESGEFTEDLLNLARKFLWTKISTRQREFYKRAGYEPEEVVHELLIMFKEKEKKGSKFDPQRGKFSSYFFLQLQSHLTAFNKKLNTQKRGFQKTVYLNDEMSGQSNYSSGKTYAEVLPESDSRIDAEPGLLLSREILEEVENTDNKFGLTEKQRDAIINVIILGKTHDAYAAELGLTGDRRRATITERLKHGLEKIKKFYERKKIK